MKHTNSESYHRNLYVLLFVSFMSYVGVSLPVPIMAPLFLSDSAEIQLWELSISPLMALGLGLAGYPLGQFFGSPILGSLSDRFGRKKILVLSMIGTGFGFLISFWALWVQNSVAFIASRFLTGLWEGNLGIVRATASDMDIPPEEKEKVFAHINSSVTSGFLFGPLIGGVLSDNTIHPLLDHKVPFAAAIILTVFACLALLFFFKDTKPAKIVPKTEALEIQSKLKWEIRFLMVISFLVTLGFDTFYEFYPVLLVKSWHLEEFGIALATFAISIAMVVSQIFLLKLVQSVTLTKKIMVSSIILSSLFFTLPLMPNLLLTLIYFPLIGCSIALVGVYVPLYVAEKSKDLAQGKIMGQLMAYRYLGDALIAMIGCYLAENNVGIPFIMASAFVLLGFFGFIAKFRNQPRIIGVGGQT